MNRNETDNSNTQGSQPRTNAHWVDKYYWICLRLAREIMGICTVYVSFMLHQRFTLASTGRHRSREACAPGQKWKLPWCLLRSIRRYRVLVSIFWSQVNRFSRWRGWYHDSCRGSVYSGGYGWKITRHRIPWSIMLSVFSYPCTKPRS